MLCVCGVPNDLRLSRFLLLFAHNSRTPAGFALARRAKFLFDADHEVMDTWLAGTLSEEENSFAMRRLREGLSESTQLTPEQREQVIELAVAFDRTVASTIVTATQWFVHHTHTHAYTRR